jgi:hypothetical protein
MPTTTPREPSGRKKGKPREQAHEAGAPARLEERTQTELYELARELGIAGRDEMSRAELIEAIRRR